MSFFYFTTTFHSTTATLPLPVFKCFSFKKRLLFVEKIPKIFAQPFDDYVAFVCCGHGASRFWVMRVLRQADWRARFLTTTVLFHYFRRSFLLPELSVGDLMMILLHGLLILDFLLSLLLIEDHEFGSKRRCFVGKDEVLHQCFEWAFNFWDSYKRAFCQNFLFKTLSASVNRFWIRN